MLEESLRRGAQDIEAEQTLGIQRLGQAFDKGDEIARRELKQITLELKSELFDHLVLALRDDNVTDFQPAINVADWGRDRTISVLMQMRQRLQNVGPAAIRVTSAPPYQPAREVSYPKSPWTTQTMFIGEQPVQCSPGNSTAMYQEPASLPEQPPNPRRDSKEKERDYSPSYLPKFKIPFRRQSSEQRKSFSSSPSSAQVREQQGSPPSWQDQQNRVASSSWQGQQRQNSGTLPSWPETPQYNSPPSSTQIYELSGVETALPLGRSVTYPGQEGSSTLPLHFAQAPSTLPIPTASNGYLGFCKGAWRLQNGDSEALKRRLEFNSGWSSSQVPYLGCSASKCVFAGRIPEEKLDKLWHSESKGVSFRWRFLAKSHVSQSRAANESYVYLCMFCALLGEKPRCWSGVDTLLAHVATHRTQTLPGEVLHRARCVVGRVADEGEDFDVNIKPVVDGELEAVSVRGDSLFEVDGGARGDSLFEVDGSSKGDSLFEMDGNLWS